MAANPRPDEMQREAQARLKQLFEKIKPLLQTIETWSDTSQKPEARLRAYYRVGRILSDAERWKYSGEELRLVTGHDWSWRREVKAFSKNFTPGQMKAVCNWTSVVGWGHIRLVVSLGAKDRRKWLQKSFQNKWTANDLYRELKAAGVMGGSNTSKGGRPVGGSKTNPVLRLARLVSKTDDWARVCREVLFDDRHDQALRELGCTDAFWKRLEKVLGATKEFQQAVAKVQNGLKEAVAVAGAETGGRRRRR